MMPNVIPVTGAFSNYLTNSTEQNPPQEDDSSSASQAITHIKWNPKVKHCESATCQYPEPD